ncbi:MAG TPA: nucleotide exchange factor GrpE [Chloroflexota bacterium]|nr:nucleotide exchange factor GrpE [Chloroflexota bacterium]
MEPANRHDEQTEPQAETPESEAVRQEGQDEVQSLTVQLQNAQALAEENLKGWQRSQADFVNYRRRTEQEKSELVKFAESGLILDLLPVLDDLERALAGLPQELRGLTWIDGILLIERKFRSILEAHGVTPIEASGKEFDPHEHEAVLRDGEPGEATVVTAELQRGYRLHDRVLRPSLVKVGRPSESEPKTENQS